MQNARQTSRHVLLTMVMAAAIALPATPQVAQAAHTPNPTSVTIAGSLQYELGCPGDWQPQCTNTQLAYDAGDDVWQNSFTVPNADFEYKAALNGNWDESYGKNAGSDNITLEADGSAIKFYYDHKTHWVTDNKNSAIATVAGNFQSALGCPGDWQPDCLRSWLQDPDGDGTYAFETTAIPAGNYEGKVALNESWDVNFGQGGVQGGPNIPFSVPANNAKVTFTYNPTSHVLDIIVQNGGPGTDNNVQWDGVRHDSRDSLYRTPGGAVSAGTPVKIRLRTFHNDVTGVGLRLFDINANAQRILPMTVAASDVLCYQAGLESKTCDFWEATVGESAPNNLWYRFIVTDGTDTDYYADNTPALDGGLGAMSDDAVDNSFALMVFAPGFSVPAWAKDAVIYQIFPDRFRNGRSNNDARTGDPRYDDPVLRLPWGTLPEGFCRNYADAATNCPWRFDNNPPAWSPTKEGPRGRDYMGGDLRGVDQQLDYLQLLGINTIYFNPIFDAGSNHSYDTQDYYKIDPYFGTQKDWENLVKHAERNGMRIVLDGVFNHMSSDSPFFDRYNRYATVGACESLSSQYRAWFTFTDVPAGTGSCVGSAGANSANYDGWFGFDSIPVLNKTNPQVQEYFLTSANSVSRHWLKEGAGGWRMDVSGDPSFPNGYWETFRQVTKSTNADALLISETWQKDSTLLRMLRGDRLDTTMNYRLRDAVIGLLTPGPFDSKGFADSGRIIAPSEFAARMESIREDYPDAAYYALMNLLDSHDTERLLWTLTPGAETTAEKERNAANVAAGKQNLRLASLIQFTVPGAPTVYYGDEVGLTGDDDPDDRRTYPWLGFGGKPDALLFAHYGLLAALREKTPALTDGDFKMLLADDSTGVIAYGRKTNDQAVVVIVNRSNAAVNGAVPVAGYLPNDLQMKAQFWVGNASGDASVVNGQIAGSIGAKSALVLVSRKNADLTPPDMPANLRATSEGNAHVALAWDAVNGAVSYNVYRSPLSGGGFVKLNTSPINATTFDDAGLRNATNYFYVVKAVDAAGNESTASNEINAMPRLLIGWANLQWPPTMNHTVSAVNRTDTVYGQVWIDGATNQTGATPSLKAQLGFGPAGSNPANNLAWTWVEAEFNTNAGNNDEFKASLQPESTGAFDYVYRYSTTNGREWLYADLNGPVASGALPANPGKLTVNASSDTSAPATPASLRVTSASPAGIALAWDAITGDATLYGYEVLRSNSAGGPYSQIARVTDASYNDVNVTSGTTYFYVVRAVDQSFNRSGNSAEVSARPELRTVTLVFNVTVPATTDGTARSVNIAGFLDRLDGGLPQWNPGGVRLTRVNATTWTITLTGREGTQIAYKYALGAWDYVEKGSTCDEIGDRLLTLSHGATGTQQVNDAVLNWRNVAPCGN